MLLCNMWYSPCGLMTPVTQHTDSTLVLLCYMRSFATLPMLYCSMC
jgi:hypothetical protein